MVSVMFCSWLTTYKNSILAQHYQEGLMGRRNVAATRHWRRRAFARESCCCFCKWVLISLLLLPNNTTTTTIPWWELVFMLSANGIEQSISGTKIRSIRNHYEFMIFNRSTSSYSIRKKGLPLMMLPIFQSVGKMWGQPFVQRVGKMLKISRNTLLWLMTLINVRS